MFLPSQLKLYQEIVDSVIRLTPKLPRSGTFGAGGFVAKWGFPNMRDPQVTLAFNLFVRIGMIWGITMT